MQKLLVNKSFATEPAPMAGNCASSNTNTILPPDLTAFNKDKNNPTFIIEHSSTIIMSYGNGFLSSYKNLPFLKFNNLWMVKESIPVASFILIAAFAAKAQHPIYLSFQSSIIPLIVVDLPAPA